jgi:PAS domain S-box-containing protein
MIRLSLSDGERIRRKIEVTSGQKAGALIVSGFILAILILYAVLPKNHLFSFDPPLLAPVLNTLFVCLLPLIVSFLFFRSYLAVGNINLLLFSSGLFALGLSILTATWLQNAYSANVGVTIYNTGVLLASILYGLGVLMGSVPSIPQTELKNRRPFSLLLFLFATAFVFFLAYQTLKGRMPAYYVPGAGPTIIRQWVLGSAIVIFVFCSIFLIRHYMCVYEKFIYWHALAFILFAIGLFGVWMQTTVGGPLSWAGRSAQFASGVYFLISGISALRSAKRFGVSVESSIASFFTDSELNYRTLLEMIADPVISMDSQNRILAWNAAAEHVFGYKRTEVIGSSIMNLFVLPGLPQGNGIKLAIPERPAKTTGRKKDGTEFPAEVTASFRPTANGTVTTLLARDITDQESAQEVLRESEHRFRQLADSSFEGLVVHANGLMLDVNKRITDMLGYDPKELIGRPFWEFIDTRYHDVVNENVRTGASAAYEVELIHRDGSRVPVEVMGKPLTWKGKEVRVAALRDITERKRAEQALRESEEKYRTIVETASEGIIMVDSESSTTYVNDSFAKMLGFLPAELIGKNITDYFDKEHLALALAKREERRQHGVRNSFESKLIRKDGSPLWLIVNSSPLLDKAGKFVGSLGMVTDITARKEAEEAIRKAHEELEKRVQERTSELSEAFERLRAENIARKQLEDTLRQSEYQVRFFASQCLTAQETERKRVAGELHDSIAASLGAMKFRIEKIAEEMKQRRGGPDSLKDLASKVADMNSEVRRIMADLRPSILDDLGIIPAMNWLCREYQKTYSHITVEEQIGVSEQEVPDALKTPIFRISQEAMNNIAKYSKASLVNLSLRKEDGEILLTIQDNGQGFDQATVKKGMGLSTMKERSQLSGGSFVIESQGGKGTIVCASWPLSETM